MWKVLSSTKIDGIKNNFSFGLDTVFESGAEMSSDEEISSFGTTTGTLVVRLVYIVFKSYHVLILLFCWSFVNMQQV